MSGARKKPTKRSKGSKQRNAKRQLEKSKDVVWDLMCWLIVTQRLFQKIEVHGNVKWKAEEVAVQALIWSWLEAKNVTDAFDESLDICRELKLKHIAQTYNSFMNALTRYHQMFSNTLRDQFQSLAEKSGGRFFRTDGWTLIAFDGSRATAPRSKANEKAFCAPNYGKSAHAKNRDKESKSQPPAPQTWITLFWHMELRLPWTWRLGPSNSSERDHVKEILAEEEFSENTLFCGDAGFIGYPIWNSILKAGGDFLIRVGGNAKLLREQADVKQLDNGLVLCWPKERMKSGDPPLRLRLVQVTVGKTKMWMLTNIVNRRQLTKKQIVRFYKMRWGIEVEFRGLKETLNKRKLRCRNSDRLLAELDWAIRAMAIAELLATRQQIKESTKQKSEDRYTPRQRSLAKTMRALRRSLKNLNQKQDVDGGLLVELAQAKVQRYNNKASKKARYRPKNPRKKPLGEPEVKLMTKQEQEKLKKYKANIAA